MPARKLKPREEQKMKDIDSLVFKFQSGDKQAGEEVMRLFGCHPSEPLNREVGKFYLMLKKGRFSYKDRESRNFINCFIKDAKARKEMKKYYQYGSTRQKAYEAIKMIMKYVEPIPDKDLQQDLRTIFIQQMQRYKHKHKNIYFAGYIYNSYGYAIVNYITGLTRKHEPYNVRYKTKYLLSFDHDSAEEKVSEIEYNELIDSRTVMIQDDDVIGNSWVRGLTCGEEFIRLNNFQRLVIKLYYEDGMNDRKISEYTGMHINTIHKHRKKAIRIIEEDVQRIAKEGYSK